ncbi:YkvA family protein [Deinococcus sp.]|uniref:YkvA family protein n=1 Tax=Deinococcus sp. TaxID=47478 RepID=UPI0038D4F3D7
MTAPAGIIDRLKTLARTLKTDLHALSIAARDPRTPWAARAVAVLVLAYALSPIDLIPDFIPVLGYLDDLLLVPAGLWLARRMIPAQVMAEARAHAAANPARLPRSTAGLVFMLIVYAALLGLLGWWWLRRIHAGG